MRRLGRWHVVRAAAMVAGPAAVVTVLLTTALPAAAGTTDTGEADLSWTATIDGRPVEEIDAAEPLGLGPDEPVVVRLEVANESSDTEVDLRRIRLEGRVMGLAFYRYSVEIAAVLQPGDELERRLVLQLDELGGEAVGLIPTRLSLVGEDGERLADETFPARIDGSVWSPYGIFGLAVAACTVVLVGSLLWDLRRSALPLNRWTRATRFAAPGAGLGLTLTFSLSAFGLLAPGATVWLPLVVGFAAGAFLVGYFLPMGRGPAAPVELPQQRAAPQAENAATDAVPPGPTSRV